MYLISPRMVSMTIKFLLLFLTACLIISCGVDKDVNSNIYNSTELSLNYSEENFTSPSLFTITSNQFYNCESAIINSYGTSYYLEITSGFRLIDSNKTICALSDLPKDIPNGSTLEITFFNDEENPEVIVETFSIEPSQINRLERNTVLDYSTNNFLTYPDHNLHDIQLSQFDYSGGSSSMQYVFKDKFDMEFSEREIMEDLFQYGETEKIISRRGFSLLDMKKVFVHHGFSASGYWMTPNNSVDYSESELDELQSMVPFISPVSLEGGLGFIVVIKINHQNITFLHPRLGYLQVPLSELVNGNLRNNEDWLIFIANYIQE